MNVLPKAVSQVIEAFEKLPGIGAKTAQRLTFYLLHVPKDEIEQFADRLVSLKRNTLLCSVCRNVSEHDPCTICSNPNRNRTLICVVEQPTDVLSIEKTGAYTGLYHVLHGAIDPLNNIGPDEIYITDLLKRVRFRESKGFPESGVKEIILATNTNMEGEATAMYLNKQLKMENHTCKITKLAHGLPIGADIEYADAVTLEKALVGRRDF